MKEAWKKKLEPELTMEDKDKLRRLGQIIPVVQYAMTYIEHLETRVKSLEGLAKSVNEALNSGDGTYKP